MSLNITTSDKAIYIDDGSQVYTISYNKLEVKRESQIFSLLTESPWRTNFKYPFSQVKINNVTITSENFDSLVSNLYKDGGESPSGSVTVTNIDDSKTESPVTNPTVAATKGQLLRGQLQALNTLNTNFGSFLDAINGEVI